jgi:hypothetical protein
MNIRPLIMLLFVLGEGCGQANDTTEASGPSYCNNFTDQHIKILSGNNDIESIRALRDLYMDCDVSGRYQKAAFELSRLAAKTGDKSDKETCLRLVEYHNTGDIQPKLIAAQECAL